MTILLALHALIVASFTLRILLPDTAAFDPNYEPASRYAASINGLHPVAGDRGGYNWQNAPQTD